MRLVITGTVVTFDPDPDRAVFDDGAVYIEDGTIVAVRAVGDAVPDGFDGDEVARVATEGVVYPGLIDLHNHLAYNFLTLWRAPKDQPYTTRYQWPRAATYGREISNPAQAMGAAAAAATLRYAEVKAAAGGVTSIQGSPPLTRAFPGWMVRNVEKEEVAGRDQAIYQSVLPAEPEALRKYAQRMKDGSSFAYHLAEGTGPELLEEFEELDQAGCIQDQLIGIHSTALTPKELKAWGKRGGAVVWSPLSNIWLYGGTTDVIAARKAGLRVCLGSDWGPSGTKSVLGELKVAALWNKARLDGELTHPELCAMVTAGPGDTLALAWGRPVGRLVEGGLADLLVLAREQADPYDNLVAATERDVRLVLVGGRPVYGVRSVVVAAGGQDPEPITVAGRQRVVVMRLPEELQPSDPDLVAQANMSWADGLATMEAVRDDPLGTVTRANQRSRGPGPEPLRFIPDMPGPDGVDEETRALTEDELKELVIAPIDTLAHDDAFFDLIDAKVPEHAVVLKDLRRFWH